MTNGAPYVGIFVYEITYMPATTFLALPDPTRHAIMALRALGTARTGHGSHWARLALGGATVGRGDGGLLDAGLPRRSAAGQRDPLAMDQGWRRLFPDRRRLLAPGMTNGTKASDASLDAL